LGQGTAQCRLPLWVRQEVQALPRTGIKTRRHFTAPGASLPDYLTDNKQTSILFTGATDGIGPETAKMLVTAGHHVLLHG
tara:strand:- start:6098 stop:6337 length:240 start_codon:yes stop_codon:yes gene_type:complete